MQRANLGNGLALSLGYARAEKRLRGPLARAHRVYILLDMSNSATSQANVAESVTVGTRLQITKGCNARGVTKGVTVRVLSVEALGADYGHSVKVRFQPINGFKTSQIFAFYARHTNRLADPIVRMNDGNPSHVIEARRVASR